MKAIRIAELNDCDAIIDFIAREWKSDHIFCRNKSFFLYQYQNHEKLNFIISINDELQINGVLGFIKSEDGDNSSAWASLWKVSERSGNAMLGLELMDYLRKMFPNRLFCSGINEKTIPLYKYMGIFTGVLKHFVFLNDRINSYEIAKIDIEIPKPSFANCDEDQYDLREIRADEAFDFGRNTSWLPAKDRNYLVKRYKEHPIYTYIISGIYLENILTAVIVMREQCVNNARVLRIVDFLGEELHLKFVSKKISELMINGGYEYVDFVCYGFNSEQVLMANFIELNLDSDEIIIPNYFSPFLKKNVKINFFADTLNLDFVKICKADGDQDRPS